MTWHELRYNHLVIFTCNIENPYIAWSYSHAIFTCRNVETATACQTLKAGDAVQHLKWNYNGSMLASTAKDKLIRIIDPRNNKVVSQIQGHEGTKGTKIEWLGGNVQPPEHLFSAGEKCSCSDLDMLLPVWTWYYRFGHNTTGLNMILPVWTCYYRLGHGSCPSVCLRVLSGCNGGWFARR